jgi:mono/diheme cytochrome c family protein
VSLRTVANVVEAIVGVAVIITVVLLFTNSPTAPPAAAPEAVAAAGGIDGAAIFGERCAGCHGGDGSGGIGPRLAGGRVVAVYPDAADEIAVVTNGRGGMPAFAERLSAEEIAAVVDYTRTVLADVQP